MHVSRSPSLPALSSLSERVSSRKRPRLVRGMTIVLVVAVSKPVPVVVVVVEVLLLLLLGPSVLNKNPPFLPFFLFSTRIFESPFPEIKSLNFDRFLLTRR